MKLLFKQRFFSWFDSYDIFDEAGQTVYTVKGELSWGHKLRIFDASGNEAGLIKEKLWTWLPKFEIYMGGQYIGCIRKEFSFFKPKFNIDFNGWYMQGNWLEWDYGIFAQGGTQIAAVSKKLWKMTDTYEIDIYSPRDALCVLMLVLAIDAEKCSRNA